jgi:hypothetical protein
VNSVVLADSPPLPWEPLWETVRERKSPTGFWCSTEKRVYRQRSGARDCDRRTDSAAAGTPQRAAVTTRSTWLASTRKWAEAVELFREAGRGSANATGLLSRRPAPAPFGPTSQGRSCRPVPTPQRNSPRNPRRGPSEIDSAHTPAPSTRLASPTSRLLPMQRRCADPPAWGIESISAPRNRRALPACVPRTILKQLSLESTRLPTRSSGEPPRPSSRSGVMETVSVA